MSSVKVEAILRLSGKGQAVNYPVELTEVAEVSDNSLSAICSAWSNLSIRLGQDDVTEKSADGKRVGK